MEAGNWLNATKACLKQDVFDGFMWFDTREPIVEALITVGKFFVIESHQVQDRGVEIMNMYAVAVAVDDVVAPLIGFTVAHPATDTTSSHPE